MRKMLCVFSWALRELGRGGLPELSPATLSSRCPYRVIRASISVSPWSFLSRPIACISSIYIVDAICAHAFRIVEEVPNAIRSRLKTIRYFQTGPGGLIRSKPILGNGIAMKLTRFLRRAEYNPEMAGYCACLISRPNFRPYLLPKVFFFPIRENAPLVKLVFYTGVFPD